ncbi:MAG: hypothetical protein R3E18_09770 [Sphingomonadaceae bacterium]
MLAAGIVRPVGANPKHGFRLDVRVLSASNLPLYATSMMQAISTRLCSGNLPNQGHAAAFA